MRSVLAARPPGGGPVFATVRGGLGRLVDAVVERLPPLRLGAPVRALEPSGRGWRVVVDGSTLYADGVVLAVPARPASRLVPSVPVVDYASVALVSLVLPEIELPDLSGFLVPATSGYAVKAVTFVDRKWAHAKRSGLTVLRAPRRVVLEASGGITPATAPEIAATGVHLLSVGWITHSPPALDVALDVVV